MNERGYFGVAVYHPKHEVNVGSLWRSAHIFGAHCLFTVGQRYDPQASDTTQAMYNLPLFECLTLDELVARTPRDCQLVCVEQTMGAIPLPLYHHPERAIYLLGAEDHGLPERITQANECIAIETPRPLNVAVAGSIVLYDRLAKSRWSHRHSLS